MKMILVKGLLLPLVIGFSVSVGATPFVVKLAQPVEGQLGVPVDIDYYPRQAGEEKFVDAEGNPITDSDSDLGSSSDSVQGVGKFRLPAINEEHFSEGNAGTLLKDVIAGPNQVSGESSSAAAGGGDENRDKVSVGEE